MSLIPDAHPNDFTIDHHAEPAGLPPHGALKCARTLSAIRTARVSGAGILADGLEAILADDKLYLPTELKRAAQGDVRGRLRADWF